MAEIETAKFLELLTKLNSGTLATLTSMARLAHDLEPEQGTAFLKECLAVVEAASESGQMPRLSSTLLTPIIARWSAEVQERGAFPEKSYNTFVGVILFGSPKQPEYFGE